MSTVYNKYVVQRQSLRVEELYFFRELGKSPETFHHDGRLATKDNMGIYNCYYLLDDVLYIGTTREKPDHGTVQGKIIEFNGFALPKTVNIPTNALNVFWISSNK